MALGGEASYGMGTLGRGASGGLEQSKCSQQLSLCA